MLDLKSESWTWYAFVTLVVAFRFTSRIWHLGSIKRLQVEDYLMFFIWCVYTILVIFMNIVAFVNTNLMTPADEATLTPESIQERIYGSKLVLLVEQCMITTQWGCKVCLLLIYYKLTLALAQQWAVKAVAIYVVTCWAVMEILYFGVWCRPFDQYWAVPVANLQCSTAINHLIVNAVFNITSDLMMLTIPLPLLITSQLPVIKKAILCGLFGMGVFVILCAVLNKYYSFNDPFSPMWTFWYIREASTAVLVANIPNCWPLLRHIFKLRSFSGSSDGHSQTRRATALGYHSGTTGTTRGAVKLGSTMTAEDKERDAGTWNRNGLRSHKLARSESSEYINGTPEPVHLGKDVPLEIWQDVEVHVAHDKEGGFDGENLRSTGRQGNRTEMFDGNPKTRTVVTASAV